MDNKQIVNVLVEDIIPNRFQPRLAFNEKELLDLADSIRMHGIIQPLILRRIGDKFEIIAGERRYKAATIAGLTKVPAVVMNTDDDTSAELALVENIQRKDLTSIEEAQSYKKLIERGMTQERVAKRLGINQSTVANRIRLLSLPKEVQDALLKNQISERHARSLLSLDNGYEQISLLNKIINLKLTVKQTDEEIERMLENKGQIKREEENVEEVLNQRNHMFINDEKELELPQVNRETQKLIIPDILPLDEKENTNDSMINFEVPFKPISTDPIIIKDDSEEENFKLENPLDDMKSKMNIPNMNNGGKNIMEAVKSARDVSGNLKSRGFNVDLEEFDFEDMYQIVIKIKKD